MHTGTLARDFDPAFVRCGFKTGKSRSEQMSSGLPLPSDIRARGRWVCSVPLPDAAILEEGSPVPSSGLSLGGALAAES